MVKLFVGIVIMVMVFPKFVQIEQSIQLVCSEWIQENNLDGETQIYSEDY